MHNNQKRVLLTGGGTGGHITPNLALIEEIQQSYPDWTIVYMGSTKGMEHTMIPKHISYIPVQTGKVRRYLSFQNLWDIGKVVTGIIQAFLSMRKDRPDVIYAKGGYVSIPPIIAGALLRIPIVLHESDVIPGLATRVGARFATAICASFPQTQQYFPNKALQITGLPLRSSFSQGNKKEGLRILGFEKDIPTVLIMGGSQGAQIINTFVWDNLRELLPELQIVHIVGKGKLKKIDWNRMFLEELATLQSMQKSSNHPTAHQLQQQLTKQQKEQSLDKLIPRYKQFQYVDEEFPHIMAAADIVISRAGATSIMELSKMQKPSLLIPLGREQSRGDQIKNAEVLDTQGACVLLTEEELTAHTKESLALILLLAHSKDRQEILKQRIRKFHQSDAAERICRILERVTEKNI